MQATNKRRPESRARKRLLLYGTLGLVVVAMIALTWFFERPSALDKDQAWTQIDYEAMPEVELLRDYIRIDTTPDNGSELAGAEFLAAELDKIGLQPTIDKKAAHPSMPSRREGRVLLKTTEYAKTSVVVRVAEKLRAQRS